MANIFKTKTNKDETITLGDGELKRNFEQEEDKKNG